ncbi:MAG TPA: response regulator [Gammaproteobacteria bacterium]|nr:response regulator [Gammaproteobacteria bacterium]
MHNNVEEASLELEEVDFENPLLEIENEFLNALKKDNREKIQVLATGSQKKIERLKEYFQNDPSYFLTIAKNSLAAVQLLKSKEYDIVLMTNKKPVLKGIDVIGQIRALEDPKKSKIPIIFASTAIVNKEDRDRLLMLKAMTMFKPYVKEKLVAMMIKAMYRPMATIPEEAPLCLQDTSLITNFNRGRKLAGPTVINENSRLVPETSKDRKRKWCCIIL